VYLLSVEACLGEWEHDEVVDAVDDRRRYQLGLGRVHEERQEEVSLFDRAAAYDDAMVAKDERVVLGSKRLDHVLDEPAVHVALVVVVADVTACEAFDGQRQEALLGGRDAGDQTLVQMNDAVDVASLLEDGLLEVEARQIVAVIGDAMMNEVAVHIQLDELGSAHLAEVKAQRTRVELGRRLRASKGDLIVETVGPSFEVDEAEERRQLASRLVVFGLVGVFGLLGIVDRDDR